jgi:uncharacterized protein YbjT (DUF2867 family)
MSVILVTGGSGHLGRDLVKQLLAQRRSVRLLSRAPGTDPAVQWVRGDLATGAGIAQAVQGVDTVVHAATLSPIAKRGSIRITDFFTTPSSVDIDGTRSLLAASQRAGVSHFVFVSIVGLEHSSLPYSRVKLAGEHLVRDSSVPWSVVRATPFFYLMAQMLRSFRWWPVWPLPNAPCNPVDTSDVAHYLIECMNDGGRGVRPEIGGPETMPFAEFGRQYQRAHNVHRATAAIRVSPKFAGNMGFVTSTGDRRGSKTWMQWLVEQQPAGAS